MKTYGREKSSNIEDRRAYFGSMSITKPKDDYDRLRLFLFESFASANKKKSNDIKDYNEFKKTE